MDMPCQKDNMDEGQTISHDPKNPAKARNIPPHPEVPVYEKWNG